MAKAIQLDAPFSGEHIQTAKEAFINSFARATQWITWPLLYVVFHLVFALKVNGRENFKKIRSPFIVIANHIGFYDSFLFRVALGLFTPHLPFRFMAVSKFNWKWLNMLAKVGVIDLVYSLFGVFTIIPGLGIEKNIKRASLIIETGGNVVMYPEGQISSGGLVGKFKKGAAALAISTRVPVIPISFRITGKKLFRHKLIINIGEPITKLASGAREEVTEAFHSTIQRLFNRV